ncbi:T9SS type A sorting domain-containing protein, partial [Candidatus Venteria ishoeyi]|uniref:T9SS type A sorting domain-containing protein n=1 Tax=Candidatus Venteria ishoeyi TaxID=1899563 RepID=UPI000CDF0E23
SKTEISKIGIFPNPASEYLYISNKGEPIRQFIIFDSKGNKVLRHQTKDSEKFIDISILPAGNYIIQFYNGKFTYNSRFVKL